MNEECEELKLVTDLLEDKSIPFQVHSVFYDDYNLKKYYSHHTVFIPDKENFKYLISMDEPFVGYRFAKGKDPNSRFDKDIDDIKKEVKKNHVRKRV